MLYLQILFTAAAAALALEYSCRQLLEVTKTGNLAQLLFTLLSPIAGLFISIATWHGTPAMIHLIGG